MRNVIRINANDLDPGDQFKPPQDPAFNSLFELAMQGDLRVYFAAVPLELIKPYALDFRFEQTPNGQQIIAAITIEAMQGRFPRMWVYESGEAFIMSDDYPCYEACIRGRPDFVPCWVLGRPRNSAVKDVQGPVDARQAAGFGG